VPWVLSSAVYKSERVSATVTLEMTEVYKFQHVGPETANGREPYVTVLVRG